MTATEQLQLMDGTVAPPECDLLTLVHQTAFIYAKSFYDNYKEFDGATYPDAQEYLNKMFNVTNSVLGNNATTIARLNRMVVVIIGSVATLAQVTAATQSEWETFVLDQMDEALEYIISVKRDEKAEYISIV